MTVAVGIICKAPIVGQSKTRLIGAVGAEGAAELAGAFLADVANIILQAGAGHSVHGVAVYAPAGREDALRRLLPARFQLMCRQDGGLGAVLNLSSQQLLADGHSHVILVNADSPTLPISRLSRALDLLSLEGDRVVLGPAIDGGYYLIGLKQSHPELFMDIPWSTDKVLKRTIERARSIALPVVELAPWYDVDDAASLTMLKAELAGATPPFALPTDPAPQALATRTLLREFERASP